MPALPEPRFQIDAIHRIIRVSAHLSHYNKASLILMFLGPHDGVSVWPL